MLRFNYDRKIGKLKTEFRGYTVIKIEGNFEAFIGHYEDGRSEIYIGSHFDKYNEDVRNFILLHEIGHGELKHKNPVVGLGYTNEQIAEIYELERLQGKYLGQEFEADEYAAKITGKDVALVALMQFMMKYKKMLEYFMDDPDNFEKINKGIEEIEKRIENIKQKSFDF